MPFDPVCLGRIGVPDAKPPPFSNGIMIYHSPARFHVGRRASPTCEGAALAASNSGSYNVRCPCEGFALTPLSRQRQSMLGMRSSAERIPSSEAGGASPFMPTGRVRDTCKYWYPGTSYRGVNTCTSTHNLPSTEYSLRHWGCYALGSRASTGPCQQGRARCWDVSEGSIHFEPVDVVGP